MTILLAAWLLIAVALPCFLAFRASSRRNGRMMLILIGLLVVYTLVTLIGGLMPLSTQPITPEAAGRAGVFLGLLLFGSSGAAVGLLIGGLGGWLLRGRL